MAKLASPMGSALQGTSELLPVGGAKGGFSWGDTFAIKNQRMPDYALPRTSPKALAGQNAVIEDFVPRQKTLDRKGAAEAEAAWDAKLAEWRGKSSIGDKLLLYDEQGHQFWLERTDETDSGWSIWFPAEEMM